MKLRFEQFVAAPCEALFAFHSDPANLAQLIEGWRGFELVSHEHHIRPGARVRVRQGAAGWMHEMVFEHFLFEPPHRFAERQVQGPFARFEHVHEFTPVGAGTQLVDRIEFALPWYRGGALAEHLVVAPTLRRLFEFRRAAYGRLVASGQLA